MTPTKEAWKRDLKFIIFRACTDFKNPDQDDEPNARKDFADIKNVIDKFSTNYIYSYKIRPAGALHKASVNYKSKAKLGPTPDIFDFKKNQMFVEKARSIHAGSVRFGDRLKHIDPTH